VLDADLFQHADQYAGHGLGQRCLLLSQRSAIYS
jgi:hypothetical protein